ncbi:MAG TPA: amidase [Anaeromyxobacteraceae bacterium]|nr:amidase [Anaeromyxobacteraceae bacterium]
MQSPADLGVCEALELLGRRRLSAEELVRALLSRIATEEPRVSAFQLVDAEGALRAARRIDAMEERPPLAGLPVGVKDVIDTAGLATERGTPIFAGRVPHRDATAIARLRAAGAVVLGKTVTTELAFYRPGKTRNPHDPTRTPGGSSSGSAAAVAARMVPAALGTQTAGSVIRPASFCGVVGMKLTHGSVPMDGVSPLAPTLDTLGVFTRDPGDLRPLLSALGIPPGAGPVAAGARRIALCRTEQWPLAAPETRSLVEAAAQALARAGAEVREVDLGPEFHGLFEAQQVIMAAEAASAFGELRRAREADLSPVFLELVRTGEALPRRRYEDAQELAGRARAALPGALAGTDALLTPSAPGEAPPGLSSTGDPAFNRIWTLLGVPCVSVPAGRSPAGLPVGVQLVAAPGDDFRLAGIAAFAAALLGGATSAAP